MNITKDIRYIGVNDHEIDLFEGQYIVPNGMAYNSYAILDGKTAVIDTVDVRFRDEWFGNIKNVLGGKAPDYLVVHHMEPDHAGNIAAFMDAYKTTTIVSSAKAFAMMQNFFGTDYEDRRVVVAEGDTLSLGEHTLTFVTAPMVHWPEVIVSYDSKDKVLFSADGFGKFGANDVEDPEGWACEARRYYIGIVGKYGAQVQSLLKKAAKLDIAIICPTHGPVLTENLGYYLDLYNTWSSYGVESAGITVAYTSVYGHTKEGSRPAAGQEAGSQRMPRQSVRSRPRRHGRSRRSRLPIRQARARDHDVQRRNLPLHAYVHHASDGAQLPEPHRRLDRERQLDASRRQSHARSLREEQESHVHRDDRHDQVRLERCQQSPAGRVGQRTLQVIATETSEYFYRHRVPIPTESAPFFFSHKNTLMTFYDLYR